MEQSKKARLIERIYENKDTEIVRLFIELMDVLVEENRERNDTARPEEIPANQGAIKQLRSLHDIFTKHPIIAKK